LKKCAHATENIIKKQIGRSRSKTMLQFDKKYDTTTRDLQYNIQTNSTSRFWRLPANFFF